MFDALARTDVEQGYVHAAIGDRDAFLFIREGRVWGAGSREDGSVGAASVASFLCECDDFDDVALCRTDLPLFLCASVIFRKPPSAHVPAALIDGEGLLKSLRALGKDAVLAVQRRDGWSLAFCRAGEPVALYAAPALDVAPVGSVADRLMELIYAAPGEVTLDVYDEIRVPPAADAGQALTALASPLPADGPRPLLVVMLGDRVVFRHRLDKAETIVGRGLEADLALDNLSVSRRHAVIRIQADHLVIDDLGSENGLLLGGVRVDQAMLKPGERIGVGKYTLAYALHTSDDEAALKPRRRAPVAADIRTVALGGQRAVVEHNGQRHKVAGAVFTIGSGADAHLRIRGFFVAPVHAVLHLADNGDYRVEHAAGMRSLLKNGAAIREAALADGDELVIAGERMRFRLA